MKNYKISVHPLFTLAEGNGNAKKSRSTSITSAISLNISLIYLQNVISVIRYLLTISGTAGHSQAHQKGQGQSEGSDFYRLHMKYLPMFPHRNICRFAGSSRKGAGPFAVFWNFAKGLHFYCAVLEENYLCPKRYILTKK